MELILINQSKLKIMLTAPDMVHYELNAPQLKNMSYTDQHTRDAFRHIFDDAEAQTGFHTTGERLLVQMYTSKCGGCEIFVTKLSDESQIVTDHREEGLCSSPLTPEEAALIRQALSCDDTLLGEEDAGEDVVMNEAPYDQKQATLRRVILSVEDLNTLLAACRRLYHMGYCGQSTAYIEEDRTPPTYHLYLEVPDGIFYSLPDEYIFLKEYGKVSRHRHTELYLSEHGRMLCEANAVETLGRL